MLSCCRRARLLPAAVHLPDVGAHGCSHPVAFGVEVAPDLHGVARLAVVVVLVGAGLYEECVLAVLAPHFGDAFLVGLDKHVLL